MNSDFFHKLIVIILTLTSVSCSGPQMIYSPPQIESGVVTTKKVEPVSKVVEVKTTTPDDQGIFDDKNFQFKTDLTMWRLIGNEDGVQTFEKIKRNSGLVAFRGEILIPAPIKKVATILVNDALQKDWVDSFVETRMVSEKNEFEHIEYNQTKVPWPFQNRDFVFRVSVKANAQPGTLLIIMKSLEDPAAPPVKGVVRGDIVHSYYYLKENPGLRATKMVVEMEVDPKGTIPLWLVNLSQKGWPHNTLVAVKKLSLREDIPVIPKLEKYFDVVQEVHPSKPVKKRGKK